MLGSTGRGEVRLDDPRWQRLIEQLRPLHRKPPRLFGQASTTHRVGVWSIHRFGDPSSRRGFRVSLLRTIKVAVHETGHMFSLLHCTAYACLVAGANHQAEVDRHPVHLCPECVAKVCWATGADPVERYRGLRDFWHRRGFEKESRFFEESIRRLRG